MSRLLVVVARGTRLEGRVADEAHDSDGVRVFTLAGQEVARVRAQDRCVVRTLPEGRLPAPRRGPTVAGTG
jgi:hypothetical protein